MHPTSDLNTLLRPVLLAPKDKRTLYFVDISAAASYQTDRRENHFFVTATSPRQAAELVSASCRDGLTDLEASTDFRVIALGQPGIGAPLFRQAKGTPDFFKRANVPRPARGILYYVEVHDPEQPCYFILAAQTAQNAKDRVEAELHGHAPLGMEAYEVCYPSPSSPRCLNLSAERARLG